nr:winged helix-turn-helix domain-containing protein [Paenibacillus phyllosphaerae]
MGCVQVDWDSGAYTVGWKGRTVVLLPKEYALLRYLYEHAGHTLTREQLLDGVWPLEAPVDRTVDDHVYRLRRKLAMWAADLQIETIRGLGYRLRVRESRIADNPLQRLAAFTEEMKGIADTYVRYGRGDALLTLSRHQQVLGFEVDPTLQLLIRVMEGDVRFIVDESEGSFVERAFLLLYFNQFVAPVPNRRYIEATIRARLLPEPWHMELAAINIVSMLMDWNEFEAAKEKLDDLAVQVEQNHWEGLMPYTANLRLEYVLRAGKDALVEEAIAKVEEQLRRYPYMREEGQFRILKGVWSYRTDKRQGLELVQEGIALLEQSQFLANLMNGYRTLTVLAAAAAWGEDLNALDKAWERLTAKIGLDAIAPRIGQQLERHLGRL